MNKRREKVEQSKRVCKRRFCWFVLALLALSCCGAGLLLAGRTGLGWGLRKQLPLNLVPELNNDGLSSETNPVEGNFDQWYLPESTPGNAYPAELLPRAGKILSVSADRKVRFVFPGNRHGLPNNFSCRGQRFKVPLGCYRAAYILGAADKSGEKAVVRFRYEGSKQAEDLCLSSWLAPESETGDTEALRLPYHYSAGPTGTGRKRQSCALWVTKFELDLERDLRRLEFSYNEHLHVFAVTLSCASRTVRQARYAMGVTSSYRLLREPARAIRGRFAAQVEGLRSMLARVPTATRQKFPRQFDWLETEVDFAESLLPGERVQLTAREKEDIERAIARAKADLESLLKGKDPFPTRRGIVLKSYLSDLDGTRQPYSLYVPKTYKPGKVFPLVVTLHGHGWYRPFQGYPPEEVPGAIVLSPHGRGSVDYMLAAEQDVIRCIQEVQRDYSVDPDRVYLAGFSMGGTGTWNIGAKFPDVFAALAPVAGNTDSKVWERLWGWPVPGDSAIGKVKATVAYAIDPVTYAENLSNLPVFCVHGSADRVVPTDHSRNMTQRISDTSAENSCDYRELVGRGHFAIDKEVLQEQESWMLTQRRPRRPRRVHLKTAKLRYGRAHWLKFEALEDPLRFGQAVAVADESGHVEVTVEGVTCLTLDISASPAHKAEKVTVELNGDVAYEGDVPENGPATFTRLPDGTQWRLAEAPGGLVKRAGIEGPIEDAFLSPFVLVYGTGGRSPVDAVVNENEARRFANDWERLYGKTCRLKKDSELNNEDTERFNLILYGGPDSNAITAEVIDKLPISIEAGRVRVGDKTFDGPDVGVKLCYPNPLNPARYVVVFAGTTWRGVHQIVNRFGNWFHWGPFDNRNWFDYGVFDDRTHSPETFLCFGFFDSRWQLDPTLQWMGTKADRKPAIARRLPAYARVDNVPASAEGTISTSTRTCFFLSDLLPCLIDQHKGPVNSDLSFRGRTLHVVKNPHQKGLGVRAPSAVEFDINGRFDHLRAEVGVDLESETELTEVRKENEWIQFEVYGDAKRLFRSNWLQGDSVPCQIVVPVKGVRRLRLQVNGSWARWHLGSAAWGNARVTGPGW